MAKPCPNCGVELSDDALLCDSCGTQLDGVVDIENVEVGEPVEFVEFTEPVEVVEIVEPVEEVEDVEDIDEQIPPIASPTLEDEPVAPSSFLKTKLPLILSIIGGLMLLAILLLSLATCTGLLGNNADIDPNSTLGTIIEDFSDDGLIEGDVLGIGE